MRHIGRSNVQTAASAANFLVDDICRKANIITLLSAPGAGGQKICCNRAPMIPSQSDR